MGLIFLLSFVIVKGVIKKKVKQKYRKQRIVLSVVIFSLKMKSHAVERNKSFLRNAPEQQQQQHISAWIRASSYIEPLIFGAGFKLNMVDKVNYLGSFINRHDTLQNEISAHLKNVSYTFAALKDRD